MSHRRALLECEQSAAHSDRLPHEERREGFVEFKDTKEWKIPYQDLKDELSQREIGVVNSKWVMFPRPITSQDCGHADTCLNLKRYEKNNTE